MKKLFLFLLLAIPALADVPTPDFGFLFNRLPGVPLARKWNFGDKLREMHNTAICVYDYAALGGAKASIGLLSTDLTTACRLPGKAVVRSGYIDVTTNMVGSGAFVALSTSQTAADLLVSTAISSLTSGQYLLIPRAATIGTYIKLTSANTIVGGVNQNFYQPTVTIATTALTAGHFRVFIDYNLSE